MRKKVFVVWAGVMFFVFAGITFFAAQAGGGERPCAFSEESKKPCSLSGGDDSGACCDVPAWLKRTSYGLSIETDQKPRMYLETVQPLYQSEDKVNTVFTHDRISIQDERGTYSGGLGYRRLIGENLLAGINTFFDYQDLHRHYRQGAGLEFLTQYLELRANAYFALSERRVVKEVGAYREYERAANGGDVEIGGPVPYLPWVKVFGSYYQYDFHKAKDMEGWKTRTEFKPLRDITINFEVYDDNKGDAEYRMDARYNLAFDICDFKNFLSGFRPASEAFTPADLKKRTLDRVERNFNIQVEEWTENSGGVTIAVGRR